MRFNGLKKSIGNCISNSSSVRPGKTLFYHQTHTAYAQGLRIGGGFSIPAYSKIPFSATRLPKK